jgi:hypothetical protein
MKAIRARREVTTPKIKLEHKEFIETWQKDPLVHPLTCGKNSSHKPLVVGVSDGKSFLYCLDCDYTQDWVPDVVVKRR